MLTLNFRQLVYGFTAFAVSLCLCRVCITGSVVYLFLIWNLFLAYLPWWISRFLQNRKLLAWHDGFLLLAWLLFLPNAPYLLTDLFHLKARGGVPLWFDLVLILSCACTGLLLFCRSLRSMLAVLSPYLNRRALGWLTYAVFLMSSLGLYLGRYLRFNSWDILHPFRLWNEFRNVLLDPHRFIDLSGFVLVFSPFLVFLFLMLGQQGLIADDKKAGDAF